MAELFSLMIMHPAWAAAFMLWAGICSAIALSPITTAFTVLQVTVRKDLLDVD